MRSSNLMEDHLRIDSAILGQANKDIAIQFNIIYKMMNKGEMSLEYADLMKSIMLRILLNFQDHQ